MIIRTAMLAQIRRNFTEAEIEKLRAAMRGEIICPAGVELDLSALDDALQKKLADQMLYAAKRQL